VSHHARAWCFEGILHQSHKFNKKDGVKLKFHTLRAVGPMPHSPSGTVPSHFGYLHTALFCGVPKSRRK
jgi:hypothetical protein